MYFCVFDPGQLVLEDSKRRSLSNHNMPRQRDTSILTHHHPRPFALSETILRWSVYHSLHSPRATREESRHRKTCSAVVIIPRRLVWSIMCLLCSRTWYIAAHTTCNMDDPSCSMIRPPRDWQIAWIYAEHTSCITSKHHRSYRSFQPYPYVRSSMSPRMRRV